MEKKCSIEIPWWVEELNKIIEKKVIKPSMESNGKVTTN
jgi:hypothetical protein